VHHESDTLLHATTLLLVSNLAHDLVANVNLSVVHYDLHHAMLFFFVKLVLSSYDTMDHHFYKLSVGRSHAGGDSLLLLLLLLLLPEHVLSGLSEHLGLFLSDLFLFLALPISGCFPPFCTFNCRALVTPLATLLRSEGGYPLVLAAALKDEMSLPLLVVRDGDDAPVPHSSVYYSLLDLDAVMAHIDSSVGHLPELHLASSTSLLSSLLFSLHVTLTYDLRLGLGHFLVNFFVSFTSISSGLGLLMLAMRSSDHRHRWLDGGSWSLGCHVNCDEVFLVRVGGHHGCEDTFIVFVAGVIILFVSKGLRIPPRLP
jgi:hypothetical protein